MSSALDDAWIEFETLNSTDALAALVTSPAVAERIRAARLGKPTRSQTVVQARASARFYADVLKADAGDTIVTASIAELHCVSQTTAIKARTGQLAKPTLAAADELFALICETPARRHAQGKHLRAVYERFKSARAEAMEKPRAIASRFINDADRRAGR